MKIFSFRPLLRAYFFMLMARIENEWEMAKLSVPCSGLIFLFNAYIRMYLQQEEVSVPCSGLIFL